MRSAVVPMRSAVVTVVAGRHDHLRRQRSALASGVLRPDLHVVVSMGDPEINQVLDDDSGLVTQLILLPVPEEGLPLAQSRNAGVTAAIGDGAVVGARALVTKDVRPYAIVVTTATCGRTNRVNADNSPAWFMPISKMPNRVRAGIRARLSGTPTWLL